MKTLKKYSIIIIFASMFSIALSYTFVEVLISKANKEINQASSILYTINQLKDVHILCMLDYAYRPHKKDMLNTCKTVENQIVLNLNDYNNATPYLNFYTKYIQREK